jgi:hypothetical protein
MPVGTDVTKPNPVPALVTAKFGVLRAKVAVTARAAVIVTSQVPVPNAAHPAPVHPVKVESMVGVAVRVTTVL